MAAAYTTSCPPTSTTADELTAALFNALHNSVLPDKSTSPPTSGHYADTPNPDIFAARAAYAGAIACTDVLLCYEAEF